MNSLAVCFSVFHRYIVWDVASKPVFSLTLWALGEDFSWNGYGAVDGGYDITTQVSCMEIEWDLGL